MNEIKLYIENTRVDLYGGDQITLTQTIKNAKDLGSLFTDFSQTFSIPASSVNNRIFQHYYDIDIDGGYNANNKSEAEIHLADGLFRKGYVGLDGVNLVNNQPDTYRITFYGEIVDLKKKLKDLTLRNLFEGYTNYNHSYTQTTVLNGLQGSLFGGGIIYPLISHTRRYYYDSGTNTPFTPNLHYSSTVNKGINFRDLKPAMQLEKIFLRINQLTDLNFAEEGFLDEDNNVYMNLYLWLSRERGALGATYTGTNQFTITINQINNWFPDGGSANNMTPPYTSVLGTSSHIVFDEANGIIDLNPKWTSTTRYEWFIIYFDVNSTSTYDVEIVELNSNTILASDTGLTGATTTNTPTNYTQIFLRATSGNQNPNYRVQLRIKTQDATFTCSSSVQVRYYARLGKPTRNYRSRSNQLLPNALVNDIDIPTQMPNITVLEFLSGLMKMFNLVAYYKPNGEIVLETLDNYYTTNEVDISEYVKVDEAQVDFAPPFQEVAYRFKDPKTFLGINFEEINGQKFGNMEYTTKSSPSVQSTDRGNKYVVQLPFEKMVYERLSDIANNNTTNVVYGLCTDKDLNPTAVEPLIFYRVNRGVSGTVSAENTAGTGGNIALYYINTPSNSYQLETINFGQEIDEYNGSTYTETLFNVYHQEYIGGVFNPTRRLFKLKAVLPLKFLLTYKLSDLIVYNARKFRINSIKTNLQTGESDLELYNVIE